MFQLTDQTVTIATVTTRAEKHGDESVPAISIGVQLTAANTLLDCMLPDLRRTLYQSKDEANGQPDLSGIEASTPILRTTGIETLSLDRKYEGWALHIEWGIDEQGAIDCGSCKVDKFKVEPMQGGSVGMSFRISTSDVDADVIGKIGMLVGQDADLSLTPPEPKPDAIDGTGKDWPFPKNAAGDAPPGQTDLLDEDAERMDPTDAFVRAHGDARDGESDTGDGGDGGGE